MEEKFFHSLCSLSNYSTNTSTTVTQWRIQDFTEVRAPTFHEEAPTYDIAKFSQKLYEIKTWTPRGASLAPHLDPLMLHAQCCNVSCCYKWVRKTTASVSVSCLCFKYLQWHTVFTFICFEAYIINVLQHLQYPYISEVIISKIPIFHTLSVTIPTSQH